MDKMIYEKEEDILFLSKKEKVKHSVDIGDFIIDINSNNLVVGIEILNASENLRLSKQRIEQIQKASLSVNYKPGFANINLILHIGNHDKNVTIPLVLSNLKHNPETTSEFAVV